MSNISTNVQAAIEFLNATETEGGEWIYRDDATRLDYLADEGALEDLGARLNRGDDDAYSFWCAETDSGEVTEIGAWSVGREVEAGDTFEDYDTGKVIEVRRAEPSGDETVVEVHIAWESGTQAWQRTDGLRDAGSLTYTKDAVKELAREAGAAGDTEMVRMCEAWLGDTDKLLGERHHTKAIEKALKNAWAQR